MDVLGDSGRRRGNFATRNGERLCEGSRECCCAPSRAERRVHEGIGEDIAPACALPCSRIRLAPRARRNGRRAAVIQPARRAEKLTAAWLSFLASGIANRSESGAGLNLVNTLFQHIDGDCNPESMAVKRIGGQEIL